MRSIRKFLTGMLIVIIALYSANMLAGGEQYYIAYNKLLQGVVDRKGYLPSNTQFKVKGDSVTQNDLAWLRYSIAGLGTAYVDYSTYTPDTDGVDKDPFLRIIGIEDPDEYGRNIYFYRSGGTKKYFTVVPAKYTSKEKIILGKHVPYPAISGLWFPDVPILWVHFQELAEVLNLCKDRHGSSCYFNIGETGSGYEYGPPANSDYSPTTPTHWRNSDSWYSNHSLESKSWRTWWENWDGTGTLDQWHDRQYYSLVYQITRFPDTPIYSPENEDILEFHHRSQKMIYLDDQADVSSYLTWEKRVSPELNGEYPIPLIPLPDLGYPSVDTSLEIDIASNSVNSYVLVRDFFIIRQKYDTVMVSDPGRPMGSTKNGVAKEGCWSCVKQASIMKYFYEIFHKYFGSVDIPVGLSSGQTTGIVIGHYFSFFSYRGFNSINYNCDARIIKHSSGEEPDGNKWHFTILQRPKGAIVPLGWKWNGTQKTTAEPLNGASYTMFVSKTDV